MQFSRRRLALHVGAVLALDVRWCEAAGAAEGRNHATPPASSSLLDPFHLGAEDLSCSACSLFVDTYLGKCHTYIFSKETRKEAPRSVSVVEVYKRRIFHLFRKHTGPDMDLGAKHAKAEEIINGSPILSRHLLPPSCHELQ